MEGRSSDRSHPRTNWMSTYLVDDGGGAVSLVVAVEDGSHGGAETCADERPQADEQHGRERSMHASAAACVPGGHGEQVLAVHGWRCWQRGGILGLVVHGSNQASQRRRVQKVNQVSSQRGERWGRGGGRGEGIEYREKGEHSPPERAALALLCLLWSCATAGRALGEVTRGETSSD